MNDSPIELFDLSLEISSPRDFSPSLEENGFTDSSDQMAGITLFGEILCALSDEATWEFECPGWAHFIKGGSRSIEWRLEAGHAFIEFEFDEALNDSWQSMDTITDRFEFGGLPQYCGIRWNGSLPGPYQTMNIVISGCTTTYEPKILEITERLFESVEAHRRNLRSVPTGYFGYCRKYRRDIEPGECPEPGEELVAACDLKDVKRLRRLLKIGVNPNVHTTQGQPIIAAMAFDGASGIIAALVEYGASVNARDHKGSTALMQAASRDDAKIVTYLLNHGAEVNIVNNRGYSALLVALKEGHTTTARIMIDYGADISVTAQFGWNALIFAAGGGDISLIETLLERGLSIGSYTKDGWSPLKRASCAGNISMVEFLLDHGARIDNVPSRSIPGHNISLAGPASAGHPAVLQLLIERGADPSAPGHGSRTALIYAVYNNQPGCVEVLLKSGADRRPIDEDGHTALSIAQAEGYDECLTLLRKYTGPD